jgi:FkbM family methyltransferase
MSPTCQIPILSHFYQTYLPESGVFVEVGAFDGETFSNTSGLADRGWIGKYIEPHPAYAAQCLNRHKKNPAISVYNYAISDMAGLIELHEGDAISTASTPTLDAYRSIPWASKTQFRRTLQVKAVRLDQLLVSANVEKNFELLVVDVEGFESRVFKSFSLDDWRPKMIIVELNDYHPSFHPFEELTASARSVRSLLQNNDYLQVYADTINSIFVERSLLQISVSA